MQPSLVLFAFSGPRQHCRCLVLATQLLARCSGVAGGGKGLGSSGGRVKEYEEEEEEGVEASGEVYHGDI